MTVAVKGRIGQHSHSPGVDSQCQTAFLQYLGFVQTIDPMLRLLQTVFQQRQPIARNAVIVPRTVCQFRGKILQQPHTVLQLCPVSGNFIEMIFFFQLCILRAVKTIFYLCLLSELKALVIAEYPPINIIKCFIFLISHHALLLSDFVHYNNFRQKSQSADTTKNALRSLLERFDQVGGYLFSQAVSS